MTFLLALWNIACSTSHAAERASAAVTAPVRTWYRDADGDGYGDAGSTRLGRVEPVGYVHDASDCDDSNDAIHPGAREICNGTDDDCDPSSDEVGTVTTDGAIYWSLQDAIDAAAPGSTVRLCSGLWFENLVIDKDLILEGVAPDQSIIDGGNVGTVISTRGEVDVTVRGITVQHGWSSGTGGGIDADDGALTVEDCIVTENEAGAGGGIATGERVHVRIASTVVSDNEADFGGGAALRAQDDLWPEVVDSEFRGNHGTWGGALMFWQSSIGARASITDSVIDGNSVLLPGGSGGGIYSSVSLSLTGVLVSNNQAASGAGVFMYEARGVADPDTEIFGNATYYRGSGGGVYVYGGGWRGGRITGNTASRGGGVYLLGDAHSLLFGTTIEDNHANVAGGGLWTYRTTSVRSVDIRGNSTAGEGGGVFVAAYDGPTVQFEDCVILDNAARAGGGGMWSEATVQSLATDWGRGTLDNRPDDVVFVYSTAGDAVTFDGLGADETFVCDIATETCE